MDRNKRTWQSRSNTDHFIKSYSAVEGKTILWKIFKFAIMNKQKAFGKEELKEFAVFYEKLNKVLDDVYAINAGETTQKSPDTM